MTARERRLVLVAGEPGIGKTRLAAAVAAEVAGDGARVLHGWCDDGVGIAYEAWVHALGGFVQSADDEEIAALAPLAPDLVRCISVVGERVPDVVARPTTDAASDRARLFDAVDSLLAQISGNSPLLLVLDDLHWADPATLGLLRWILSSERGGPMLVLGTYRDTDVDRRHPLSQLLADLRRDPRVERVALRGLEEQAIGALLHDRAGHDAPPEFVTALHDETDGNPFFAEEVVAHLAETGAIFQRDGIWTTDRTLADLGLPEGVRDVVGRRLSRLTEATNDLLSVAAVVGREFDLSTVAAAAGVARGRRGRRVRRGRETRPAPGSAQRSRHARVHARVGAPDPSRGDQRPPPSPSALADRRSARGLGQRRARCRRTPPVRGGPCRRPARSRRRRPCVAAEEAAAIGALDAADDHAHRALALIDDSALDAPELRCRAILVIGDCLRLEPGRRPRRRARSGERGWLARGRAWLARHRRSCRDHLREGSRARRRRPHRGRARAGRARHGRRRRMAAGAGRDRCPAGVRERRSVRP